MVLLEVIAESSFWIKHLFDILTFGIGLVFTIALYIWARLKKSHQLRMYIPTIWTSLGILFTFVSIYNGLTDEELLGKIADGHIADLINRIIPAFSTSIIGIIGAIICSIINKGLLAGVEDKGTKAFNRLIQQMGYENELTADSPELLLFKIISAVNQKGNSIESALKTNQTTTTEKSDEIYGNIDTLLNRLNSNTNKAINDSFIESLDSIHEEFSELKDKLENLMGKTNDALNNAIKEQGTAFNDEIKATRTSFLDILQKQNESLVDQLGKLNDLLGQKIQSMQQSNKDTIVAFVRDVKHDFVTVVKENIVKESEERTAQLKGFITDENKKITDFVTKQERLYQNIQEGMQQTVSDIRKLFEEDVKQTIEQFAKEQHERSTQTITECNKELVEKSKEYLNNHLELVNDYIKELTDQIDDVRNKFVKSIGELSDEMSKKLDELHGKETELIETTIIDNRTSIGNLLGENKQEVQKAIADLGSNLQSSFDGIKGVITTSIQTNKDNIDGLLKHYKESISEVSNEIKTDNEKIKDELMAAQKGWKDAAEDMERKHQEEVIKINGKAQQDILKISNAIIGIERTLQQSLNNIAENITNSISKFNSKQDSIKTEAVKQNEELLKDIRDKISKSFQINTLQTATGELVNSINGTLNRFNSETNRITDSLSNVEKSIKESSDKYAEAIRNYDEKIDYIGDVINLFKTHITDMAILRSELEKIDTNQLVHDMKVDAETKCDGKKEHKQ